MSRMDSIRKAAQGMNKEELIGMGASGIIGAGLGALGMVGGAAAIGMNRSDQRAGAAGFGAAVGFGAGFGAAAGGVVGKFSRLYQMAGAKTSRLAREASNLNPDRFSRMGMGIGAATGFAYSTLSSNRPVNRGPNYDAQLEYRKAVKKNAVDENLRQLRETKAMNMEYMKARARMGY